MEPALLKHVLKNFVLPFRLDDTPDQFLTTLERPDAQNEMLAWIIEHNQAYDHLIKNQVLARLSQSSWAQGEVDQDDGRKLDSKKILIYFGKKGARNLTLALQLLQKFEGGFPKKIGAELPKPKVDDALKFSLPVEEFFEEKRMAHSFYGFLGGFIFDQARGLCKITPGASAATLEALGKLWADAFIAGQVAYKLGSSLKVFDHQKYSFPATTSLYLGKFVMSVLFARPDKGISWNDFQKNIDKMKSSAPEILLSLERKTFGISHNEIASLILREFDLLAPAEKGVFWYDDPLSLKVHRKKEFPLAVILKTAVHLTSNSAAPMCRSHLSALTEIGITTKEIDSARLLIKGAKR